MQFKLAFRIHVPSIEKMINLLNAEVRTTHKSIGLVLAGSLLRMHVPNVTGSVINKTGCKAGTTIYLFIYLLYIFFIFR